MKIERNSVITVIFIGSQSFFLIEDSLVYYITTW